MCWDYLLLIRRRNSTCLSCVVLLTEILFWSCSFAQGRSRLFSEFLTWFPVLAWHRKSFSNLRFSPKTNNYLMTQKALSLLWWKLKDPRFHLVLDFSIIATFHLWTSILSGTLASPCFDADPDKSMGFVCWLFLKILSTQWFGIISHLLC